MVDKTLKRRMKILIATSDLEAMDRVRQVFVDENNTTEPFHLSTATTFDQVRSQFRSFHPDLVLIVLGESRLSKKRICAHIRKHEGKRHTGIIFLSESTIMGDQMAVDCLEMGADDFLTANCTKEEVKARVRSVLRLKAMTDELRHVNHRLKVLSMTDELTGLSNMRNFNHRYMEAIKKVRHGDSGIGVMMMDLDHFKSVNDTSNHLVGSYVISEVGKLLRTSGILGREDLAARYGGDEYVVYSLCADVEILKEKAEKIRQKIAEKVFAKDGVEIRITSSIGVSWAAPGFQGKPEEPIKAADFMLYHSKEMGRNRVSAIALGDVVDLDEFRQRKESDREDVECEVAHQLKKNLGYSA